MVNKFKKSFIMVFIFVFAIYSCGCATYLVHPEFKERYKLIKTFSVMPPEVIVYKITFKGDNLLMYDLIPIVAQNTIEEIKDILTKKGYEYKELKLDSDFLEKNPEIKTALFNVRQLFNKAINDIEMRKKKRFEYTLGSDINLFTDLSGSDILIFVKEEGFKKSGGEIAKDIAKSLLISIATLGSVFVVYYPSATVIKIAVVDGNTGEILWYNHNIGNHNFDCANEKALKASVRSVLRPFPICFK